ncbi:hypothetical protein QTP86_030500 [Hemibagrus guttatus]|nr:hypothetical protein QTP86_030500 [Hemibagrus guttatus]
MVMADPSVTLCERLTRRHVGNVVGHENIVSASRMNSAIVVFLNDVEKTSSVLNVVKLDHLAWACPERPSDPGPAAEGPGAAAAPDLTESEPQAQPAAQKPTGATPALEKPRTTEPAVAEPRSARPDRKKPWSTEKNSVGSGAVLEPPALTEAGTEV